MGIKVVSFSATRLAGAPIRIAQALNAHSDIQIRHVDLKRWGRFDHDHVHEEAPEETLALVEDADIIHLYNRIWYESTDFAPVNFATLRDAGKAFVQQFESTPQHVAEEVGKTLREVLDYPIPKIVIPHYPERFLPSAYVVPNIVAQDSPAYSATGMEPERDVLFTPTWMRSAWMDRWDTKGTPETVRMLRRLERRTGAKVEWLTKQPLEVVLQAKARSRIILDELVTGSYHLSAIEGICFGKPTLAYLDARTDQLLRRLTGASESPFINTRLEDAEEILVALLADGAAMSEIGQASRKWVDRHWRDDVLVNHYVQAYRQLLEDPTKLTRQAELRMEGAAQTFLTMKVPDAIYSARQKAATTSHLASFARSVTRRLVLSVPAGCRRSILNAGIRARDSSKRVLDSVTGTKRVNSP